MPLHDELNMPRPFGDTRHETALGIVLTAAMLTKEATRILKPFGLTDAQFNILMLLKDQAVDGCLTQTDLGDMLLVNRSNITGLMDRMERSGLVQRVPSPDDRRVNHIEMTPRGRKVLAEAHDVYYRRMTEIMDGMDDGTAELVRESLAGIRATIK